MASAQVLKMVVGVSKTNSLKRLEINILQSYNEIVFRMSGLLKSHGDLINERIGHKKESSFENGE